MTTVLAERPKTIRAKVRPTKFVPPEVFRFGDIPAVFKIRDKQAVLDFLNKNRDLLPVLKEAPEQIYRVFGPSVTLTLEIETVSESSPAHEHLWINVGNEPSLIDPLDALHQIDRLWLTLYDRSVSDRLSVFMECG